MPTLSDKDRVVGLLTSLGITPVIQSYGDKGTFVCITPGMANVLGSPGSACTYCFDQNGGFVYVDLDGR